MWDELDFFVGQATPKKAQLYVRWQPAENERPATAGGTQSGSLSGEVYGPFCERSETLPARFALRDLGPGPSLLSVAEIIDPVYWRPELPAIYRISVSRTTADGMQTVTHDFGLQGLHRRDRAFYLDRERTILRGGFLPDPTPLDLDWSQVAIVYPSPPTAEKLQSATKLGIITLISLADARTKQLAEHLRFVARFTAVIGAILPPQTAAIDQLRQHAPNLLFAVEVNEPAEVPPWAEVILAAVDDPSRFTNRWQHELRPVLPVGCAAITTPAEIRTACDRLRRELAPLGQYSGYLVKECV